MLTNVRHPSQGGTLWDANNESYGTITSAVELVSGLSIDSSGHITGTVTNNNGDSAEVGVFANYGEINATAYITFEKNKQGDRGLAGKVMRGVNVFNPNNTFDYEGMDDTESGHIYYDVVSYTDPNNNTTKLYYCKICKKGSSYAKQVTPGTDPDVWVEATNFAFVATDLLFAANAYIGYLTNMGFYLKDGNGNVVGGAQGSDSYIFWAGNDNPATAPFSVTKDGVLKATSGYFSGRLMLPFVDVTSDKTLASTDSSSLVIKVKETTSGVGHVLTLQNNTDFNGWILNVYIEPIVSRMQSAGVIDGSILIPEKATSSVFKFFASRIMPEYGGFFQFTCVAGQWVLINYNAAGVIFTQATP